jgi:putative ABC transport system substrate-binding protein
MDRRRFIGTLAGGLLAAPLAAEAQPAGKVAIIGILTAAIQPHGFREGLRDLGYIDGQTIMIVQRASGGRNERFPELVAELLGLKVDVIVSSATPAVRAAKEATGSVPIVMAGLTDPIAAGLVQGLARPGANVTGLTNIFIELSGKRLELLKEAVPPLSRVVLLANPDHPGYRLAFKLSQEVAERLDVRLIPAEVRRAGDFEAVFASIVKEHADGLHVLPDPITAFHRRHIAEFAQAKRLPAVYATREWPEVGGLLSYGTHWPDVWRRAAVYVDKILKGAKPADLPVEQPTKFELVINLKTAKAIGLTIAPSLLARADQVIE